MVNRPSVPELITVNSEALQTQIRDLLPSQNGFGSELQASNVITPIIDLTAAAEGSGLPINLQQCLAFGSNTQFNVVNATTVLTTSPGFYRVTGVSTIEQDASTRATAINITDGLATKALWQHLVPGSASADSFSSVEYDVIMFLRAGDSLTVSSGSTLARMDGSFRQVATGDGTLVQPVGFPL
jgi:hypothetical protein